jgi:alpha-D-ribose 1-methylphosphonate 5-triphosphate synthase subunit PhnH
MKLDPVHDLQRAFRKILAATASPGTIADISVEAGLLDIDFPGNKGLLLVALVLLDAETSFCASAAESPGLGDAISRMTYSRQTRLSDADFVFAFGKAGAAASIASAKAGTLVDPQLGATVVLEAGLIESFGPLALSGPGIESSARLGIDLESGWIAARSAKNREFPLGVDLVFVDQRCRLACLPRTTLVRDGD